MTRPTNNQRNRRRPQYVEQYEPHGFRVDTSELFSAGQILRWVGSLLVISAIAAISYNNLVSNITSVENVRGRNMYYEVIGRLEATDNGDK